MLMVPHTAMIPVANLTSAVPIKVFIALLFEFSNIFIL